MKIVIYAAILMLMADLVLSAEPPAPAITIPPGVIAASQAQKELIKKLAILPVGASKADVITAIGAPADPNTSKWYYELHEDRLEGGYYITAELTFTTNGLADGRVGYGHETLTLQDE